MNIVLVFSTAPDSESARTLARTLVEERLAACASLLPGVESVYHWQGALENAREVMLLLKTTPEAYPRLEARLRELHPYELPEIVAVDSRLGLPGYFAWVAAETGTGSTLEGD